jgi:hypothetical protein
MSKWHAMFPNLTELYLDGVSLTSSLDMMSFVAGFTALERLSLSMYLHVRNAASVELPKVPVHLHHLHVDFWWEELSRWLTTTTTTPTLTHLGMYTMEESEYTRFEQLLQLNKSTIRTLELISSYFGTE